MEMTSLFTATHADEELEKGANPLCYNILTFLEACTYRGCHDGY